MEASTSSSRVRLTGAAVAAALLVIAGVVALNHTGTAQVVSLEHAQAIAHAEASNVPMSHLPDEAAVKTPRGWVIDSDEAVAGAAEEEVSDTADGFVEEELAADDDIDSPEMVEQDDETGENFVAELEEGVSAHDEEQEDGAVAADSVVCRRRKTTRLVCKRSCVRKCGPVTQNVCRRKKFCRCFCKYAGKKKAAVKCVTYKRKLCNRVRRTLCRRQCKKFCKRVPHGYSCCTPGGRPRRGRRLRRFCRRTCRRVLTGRKCGKCRCRRLVCGRTCTMMCR